jgi:hypothetical protein
MKIEDKVCNRGEGDMMIFFKKNKEKHEYQGLETFSQT